MPELPRVLAPSVPSAPPVRAVPRGRGLALVGQEMQRAAHVTASVYDAEQRAKTRLATATVATDLERFAFELAEDPDYDSHEKRFDEKREELLAKHRGGLAGAHQADFDATAGLAADRFGLSVAQRVRERRIDTGRAAGDEERERLSGLAARASSDADRAVFRDQGLEGIREDVLSGLRSAQEATKLAEAFDREIGAAELTELTRLSPGGAVRVLTDPKGPYFGTMPEAERQVWLTRATDAHEAQLREEHAARQRAQADFDRSVRLAGDEASKQLTEQSAGDGVSVEEVAGFRELLSPPEFRAWMKVAQGGGRLRDVGGGINPAVYVDLYDRANRGEDIADETKSAYLAQQIGKTEHDALRRISEDTRFKDARTYLSDSIRLGEAVNDPTGRFQAAQALMFFEEWSQANPNASREAAMTKARSLGAAALAGRVDVTLFETPPLAVMSGAEIDVDATAAAVAGAFERGEIDEAEAARQASILQRIETARRAAADRKAALARQSEAD